MKVMIIMGSKGDLEWSKKIAQTLSKLGIESTLRIASAHKVPFKVLEIIKEYEGEDVVFVTVAGRSNALSGFVDAHTVRPVIACPPYSDKFAGADIFSSLRMPSGVCPMVVLEPEQAALASAKILAMKNKELEQRIKEYQEEKRREIEKSDKEVVQNG
jgi:5-(carboxyamino)imidazole ribonucleotide mutase